MPKNLVQHQASAPRESIAFARKPFYGARAVGSFLPSLTTKALQKYGFSTAALIMDWPVIMGREFARYAAPERIKWPRGAEQGEEEDGGADTRRAGATLVLRVDGAKALDVQYRARQVVERINAYFGYAAIAQLRVIQAPIAKAQEPCKPRARAEPLTGAVTGIGDAGLRDALARLGAEIRTGR